MCPCYKNTITYHTHQQSYDCNDPLGLNDVLDLFDGIGQEECAKHRQYHPTCEEDCKHYLVEERHYACLEVRLRNGALHTCKSNEYSDAYL